MIDEIIEFMRINKEVIEPIWFSLGVIGFLIMYWTRGSFYKNRSLVWYIIAALYYLYLGPLMFLISLVTLFNPENVSDVDRDENGKITVNGAQALLDDLCCKNSFTSNCANCKDWNKKK